MYKQYQDELASSTKNLQFRGDVSQRVWGDASKNEVKPNISTYLGTSSHNLAWFGLVFIDSRSCLIRLRTPHFERRARSRESFCDNMNIYMCYGMYLMRETNEH
jgi:hypothetical protein